MNRYIGIITLFIVSFLISSCGFPGQSEPTADLVATQVAIILTESAVAEEQEATETLAPSLTATESIIENTATSTATVTETPTATQNQSDPAVQLGDPAWTEEFNGTTSAWDFDYDQATFEAKDGFLNLTAKANANWYSWYVSSPKLKDAYLEATIQMPVCSGLDRFGLAVRASSDGQQFYFMGITCDGQWGFYRMGTDLNISEIIAYRTAEQLDEWADKPHRIGIWMKGSTFTLYIDGEEVGTATDSTLADAGYTGFLIVYATNPGYTVMVDELKYWNVP